MRRRRNVGHRDGMKKSGARGWEEIGQGRGMGGRKTGWGDGRKEGGIGGWEEGGRGRGMEGRRSG